MMTNKETILAFTDRINAHDVDGLAALMSDDHTFIDAHGNQVSGRERMTAGWHGYFEWFPDCSIPVTDVFEDDDKLALLVSPAALSKTRKARSGVYPQPGKRL